MADLVRRSWPPEPHEYDFDLEPTQAELHALWVWGPAFLIAVSAGLFASAAGAWVVGFLCVLVALIAGGKDVITLMRMGRRFQSVMLEASTMRSLGYSEYIVKVDQVQGRVRIALLASEPPGPRRAAPYVLLERLFNGEQSEEAVECKMDFEAIADSLREAAQGAAAQRAIETAQVSAADVEAALLVKALQSPSSTSTE